MTDSVINSEHLYTGHCDASWGMYIDGSRSWIVHGGAHRARGEGGIQTSDVVGVLISFNHNILLFYLNKEIKATMKLESLPNIVFPAVSLNRSSSLKLKTGIDFPVHFVETFPPETVL